MVTSDLSVRAPTARLIAPSLALAGCVRAYISRSTVGADLSDNERLNHFPVNPTCTLTWCLQGRIEWIRRADEAAPRNMPSGVLFTGPHTLPCTTFSPGPVRVFMCMLMPDAVHELAAVQAGDWINRVAALPQVLGADWQQMAQAVFEAADDAARVACIEAFMLPRWRAARRDVGQQVGHFRDWVRSLAMRAASSGLGSSVRQVERRIKRWAGLPLRDVRGLARAEQLLLQARHAQAAGRLDWSAVAAEAGFADQAHMCRAVRRASGSTPGELQQRIDSDEPYWVYRIWR